jgi:small subunit ribosomal protein S17
MTHQRRRLIGKVTSAKMTRTVVVTVQRSYRHPLYGKVVHSHRCYKAHDELGCQEGDEVRIVESRPLSREKRWVVEQNLSRGGAALPVAEQEVAA